MTLENLLIVSALIFGIGFYGVLSKRNSIAVLMCLELMFNAVIVSAVALSRYVVPAKFVQDSVDTFGEVVPFLLTGQIFAVFIVAVSAAEVVLGVAIVVAVYRGRETIFITDMNQMRH